MDLDQCGLQSVFDLLSHNHSETAVFEKFSLLGKKAKANKITNKRPVPKETVVFEQFSVHNGGRFI